MIDFGLFEFNQELRDDTQWSEWANAEVKLRCQLFPISGDISSVSGTEVRKAIAIAQACYGDYWGFQLRLCYSLNNAA